MGHDHLIYHMSDLHCRLLEQPCVALWFTNREIKLRPSDFINEIDGVEIVTCIDGDQVNPSPRDRRALIEAITSNAPYAATCPTRKEIK